MSLMQASKGGALARRSATVISVSFCVHVCSMPLPLAQRARGHASSADVA